MDKLIYQRSDEQRLYIATSADSFWTAFLPVASPAEDVDSICLGDTPKYAGFYLFGNKKPSDYSNLSTKLQSFLFPLKPLQWGGIVWIKDVESDMDERNVVLMQLQKSGEEFVLLSSFSMNVGNSFATLAISASGVMSIKLDCKDNRFLFSWSNIPNAIRLTTNHNDSVTAYSKLEIAACGILAGGIRFLADSVPNRFFSTLDTSIKFFFQDIKGNSQEISSPPFYDPRNEILKLQISIHPLDLLNENSINTYIAFLGISQKGGEEKPAVLSSCYRSDYGTLINLVPEPNLVSYGGYENIPNVFSPIIVFSERKKKYVEASWYTVPSGNFRMTVEYDKKEGLNKDRRVRLMCGMSGTETFSINVGNTSSGGDYMVFKPGCPAHIPQFPIDTDCNKVGDNVSIKELDDTYLTVWTGFSKGEETAAPIIYNSQPKGNPLFLASANNGSSKADVCFMDFYPTNSGELDKVRGDLFFPLFTYCEKTVAPVGIYLSDFENQIMLPSRKLQIDNALKEQATQRMNTRRELRSEGNVTLANSVTPQGFLIQVDEATGTWENVQLTSNRYKDTDGISSSEYTLEFQDLTADLQRALQTDQLFLVVSFDKNNVLGKFKNEMQLDGWPFIIDIPQTAGLHDGQYENVLIFKYCDKALSECVGNIQFWTYPEVFNDTDLNGLPNLSSWLSEYIEDGINKFEKQGDIDYYKFWSIVTDPSWKGLIALKVNISLTTFPAELQGLLAGINLNEFYVHHFGIDASTVKQANGNVAMSPNSSMFAMIDYEDEAFRMTGGDIERYKSEAAINTNVDYEFKVLLLKVMFANSRITDYHSYIALTVNRLFGERVNADRENLLVLNGSYESQDGIPSYTFSVEGDNLMKPDSQTVHNVEITKAGFVTSVSVDKKNAGMVESAFSLFGFIDFHALEGFDMFSFGNEGEESGNQCGLAFSNIQITLRFPLEDPVQQIYGFATEQASFDMEASYVRKKSLYNHFPLQITGFVAGTPDDTPSSRGFLDVELTSLAHQQPISDYWHGLVFKLDMGSLGALANNAGFDAQLIVAWNAGGTGAAAYLKLPGVNAQAPALNLQGVLRLDLKNIRLCMADDGVSYLMKLDDIALNFLGLSFPNKGKVGLFLFGNPSGEETSESSLGWYGGYKKK